MVTRLLIPMIVALALAPAAQASSKRQAERIAQPYALAWALQTGDDVEYECTAKVCLMWRARADTCVRKLRIVGHHGRWAGMQCVRPD